MVISASFFMYYQSTGIVWHSQGMSFVYFIQAESGPIKIGFSLDVRRRHRALQQAHFEKLTVLGYIIGTEELEKSLKVSMRSNQIRGEWFRPTSEVLSLVSTMLESKIVTDSDTASTTSMQTAALTRSQRFKIVAESKCDERSVAALYNGGAVRSATRARITAAARRLKLPLP